jgi:hypothetical protein
MSKIVYSFLLATILTSGLFVGCSKGRADAEISSEVQSKINADSNIVTKQVAATSNNGIVTLSGTVGSDFERTAASGDASQVKGVKTVLNNLQVAPAAVADTSSQAPPPPLRKKTKSAGTVAPKPSKPVSTAEVATDVPVVTIPAGTSLSIRLIDAVDSEKNQSGDIFTATLASPVLVEGRVVVPKNADVEGKIQELKSAGHFAGRSEISLALTKLSFNGKTYPIETKEYTQEGTSRGKRTAATVGGGAAVGALIGGLVGGGKGALIGAGAGAGAGTGVQAVTKGQQIHLASESILEFQLNAPLAMR